MTKSDAIKALLIAAIAAVEKGDDDFTYHKNVSQLTSATGECAAALTVEEYKYFFALSTAVERLLEKDY